MMNALSNCRIAKPWQLKPFPTPPTPAFPTLAPPTLNLLVFNILPTTGGRVVWSYQLVAPPRSSLFAYYPDSMHQSLPFPLVRSHQSPATFPPHPHWALVAGLWEPFGVQSGGETRST